MAVVEVSMVASWLLTYLLHSTLLLGMVALLTLYVVRRESLRETLWKAALVGSVVSATLAVAVPRPGAARIDLAALGVEGATAAVGGIERGDVRPVAEGDRASTGVGSDRDPWAAEEARLDRSVRGGRGGAAGSAGALAAGSGDGAAGPAAGGGATGWVEGLVAVWVLIASLLLARLGYRHVRLRLLLRNRTLVSGTERAAGILTELRRTAGVWKPVRLTSTPVVATPLALGGAEICVPERFLSELDENSQRAALAHELAHLKRADPFWQLAASVLAAALFFQPLNGVARRGIRSAAEYLADGWAVAQTGSRLELARCLAAVAGWAAPSREPALTGTVAMAEGGSPLLARVQRLLERDPEPVARPALRLAVAGALIVGMAGFGPVFGSAPAPAESGDEWPGLRDGAREGGRDLTPEAPREGPPREGPEDARERVRGASQDPLEVHRFDRPGVEGDGFVARLNEAGRAARQSPYWVAYAIPSKGARQRVVMDSDPWSTGELDGRALSAVLGVEDALTGGPDRALVLVRLVPAGAATRVERITVRRPELGMRLSGAVYWLGLPEPGPSFRWFRDIYLAVDDPRIREAAVEAMAVHDVPEAAPFLRRGSGSMWP